MAARLVVAGALVVAVARAVTPVPDSAMNTFLNQSGLGLAMAAAPMYFFCQALGRAPCYPTFAVAEGKQAHKGSLCRWPDTGCDCRNPGVATGNEGPSFPVYYSYKTCGESEIRVAYNLFYEKDGFQVTSPFANGHGFDWENVIVSWGKGSDGNWRPSKLLLSQHSGYETHAWAEIQNTFNTEDGDKKLGLADGRTDLDHPKVYVAWSKHAQYDDRKTGWYDILSQSTANAVRCQDWWYYPRSADFILADAATEVGKHIAAMAWGDASSTPVRVDESLCTR